MSPTKAPDQNGLPAFFYQKLWPIVGSHFTKACLGVLNDGHDLDVVNRILITLIPKVKRAERITDFRSSSLCKVLHKILDKALANRFRGILGDVISKMQSVFIPGRLIFDNDIVGCECMHALKRWKKGSRGALALKLDMSKAYDRVECDFLVGLVPVFGGVRRRKGRRLHWGSWKKLCISKSIMKG
ncbi:hypothetical protein Ddye_011265 [Dipteronia dyeriana]|uniref:Reverse transcriptase domain-containing protein n=1 Tax=Dipteronia dyeriana TaxID=168575 RepID=A0AAD9X275_9ROSI|nr:hypothetical protein Ddye_011265 [Dipteronia dyeriana]